MSCSLFGYNSGICLRDLCFISYAGVIRGAVAFGLVLRIEPDVEHRSVIVTTCLAIVCFTTIFLGSTVATVQRCLFGKIVVPLKHGEGPRDPNKSHHEEFMHPNADDVKMAGEDIPIEAPPSPLITEKPQVQ